MSRPTPPTYKTRNWSAYNEALKRRGSLTIWFDPEMSWDAAPTGRRGRQQTYSNTAPDLPDDEGSVRHGASPDVGVRIELTPIDRLGLGGARLQHPQPSPEDLEGQNPLSRVAASVAATDRYFTALRP